MMLRISLAIVFALAAWLRFRLPQLPLGTHDTWGYLYPALSGLAGEGMPETNARGIAYPLFLRLVLGTFSNFSAVAVTQHLLGLLSGLLWWWSWNLWVAWLPDSSRQSARWCGVGGLALYLCNAQTIFYETTLRPEGIFPFVALAGVGTMLAFVRARWVERALRSAWWAGLAILSSLVCLSLKPSWGLAAGVPVVLIASSLAGSFPPVWRGATAALCGLVGVLWVFVIPTVVQWRDNEASSLFLPETLFVQHAPAIAEAMAARDTRGELSTAEKTFLANFQDRLEKSRTTHLQTFRNLGHNPDYLLYESDALAVVPAPDSLHGKASFLWQGYLAGWKERPMAMLSKIASQTAQGFGAAHKSLYAPEMIWRARVQTSADVLRLNRDTVPVSAERLDYNSFAAATDEMLAAAPEKLRLGPPFLAKLMQPFGTALVAGCMIGWPLLFYFGLRRGQSAFPAIALFGIFWATALGSVLTVAIVSSFDITRYAALQSFLHAFLLAGALCFLFSAVHAAVRSHGSSSELRPEEI